MKTNHQSGFIKAIIIIIIAIAVLSYFGINMKAIWELILKIWHNVLETPFQYIWEFWVDSIWTPFISSINSLKQ